MAARNVETFRAAHEAFNEREFDAVLERMTKDAVYHDRARGEVYRGRDGFRQFLEGWTEAFSDGRVTEPTYTDGGDTVVALFTARGRNDGPLGPHPATGREMNLPMCEITRFDEEGRIVGGEIYYDQLTMMTQLGHVQPAAEATPAG